MKLSRFKIAALVVAVTALATEATQAQWYASAQSAPPPLYPYQAQPRVNAGQPFAVEVSPGAYVIHRPEEPRNMRRHHRAAPAPQPVARVAKKPAGKTDPALVEELRQRVNGQKVTPKADSVVNTTKYVRHKPTVVEKTRYVDLPPRVVERYTVVDDSNGDKKVVVEPSQDNAPVATPNAKAGKGDKNQKRVIQADAEITILGPDRMTIQLYRKGERGKNARIN